MASMGNHPATAHRRRINGAAYFVAGITAMVIGLATGVYYLEYVALYESTDDAFIEAHVAAIAPQVAGRVAQVLVKDNQVVKQGDVLLEIDRAITSAIGPGQRQSRCREKPTQKLMRQFAADQAGSAGKSQRRCGRGGSQERRGGYKRYQAVGDPVFRRASWTSRARRRSPLPRKWSRRATRNLPPKPKRPWTKQAFKLPPRKLNEAGRRPVRLNSICPTPK